MTIEEHTAVCTNKVTYFTLEDAVEAEEMVWRKYNSFQRYYRCPFCGYWHLKTVNF